MGWPGESATGAFAQSNQYNSARMTNRRLAILGAGNMGRALIGGLLAGCGPGVAVVRAMPNRPALVGAAATGLFAPPGVTEPQRAAAAQVLSSVGEVVWVPTEAALDVVTALSGSGPAYFFLLAQLLAEAAAGLGPQASAARRL